MVAKQFEKEILSRIDRFFSYEDGLLIECSTAPKEEPVLLICVSTFDNPVFPNVPQRCLVWKDERLIYEGSVRDCVTLSRLCRQNHVKLYNFTNTMRLEKKSTRIGMVMCDAKECSCRNKAKCPCRVQKFYGEWAQ